MEKNTKNEKETSLIKNVLTSEIKFIMGIVVFVFGIAAPYYSMKEDIALIKNNIANINANHEVHIQDLTQQIKDLNTQQVGQEAQIIELQKQIIISLSK